MVEFWRVLERNSISLPNFDVFREILENVLEQLDVSRDRVREKFSL